MRIIHDPKRPMITDYINELFTDFTELHGDRCGADDGAIVCGLAWLAGRPVTVIAQEKGANLQERIRRNFGCPQPEGYRKAMRMMEQAERFRRPVVCLVDTQGAFCGKEAEEHGMGAAIAQSMQLLASLTVPVVSVVIGEGGSGGALALAVGNRVAMQEHAVYSVLSPEGFGERWHPSRQYERFCAEGRMLFLSLWPAMTREPTKAELYDRCHLMGDIIVDGLGKPSAVAAE